MNTPDVPWVVVSTVGLLWIGLANSEAEAWEAALGWENGSLPDVINERKALGWYAAQARTSWINPKRYVMHVGAI